MYKSRIETPTESHVEHYKWATEMAQNQQAIFWPAEELGVEEDESDFRTKLTEAEKHGVMEAQKILTKYEGVIGGNEYWGSRISQLFPRPEIVRMCACFSNVELNSHAPFYRIGNEVLGVATDDFYDKWKYDPALKTRIDFLEKQSQSKDALIVTATLTFMEGAVLFSIFGYFKGFNTRGHNKIPHFVSGIDASTKDENYHSLASSGLFKVCLAERIANGSHTPEDTKKLQRAIRKIARTVYKHELQIIDNLFAKGDPTTITKHELQHFLRDRINICMDRLDMPPMFKEKQGVISDWFYDQLSKVKVPDFFASTQVQYTKNWNKSKLIFKQKEVLV